MRLDPPEISLNQDVRSDDSVITWNANSSQRFFRKSPESHWIYDDLLAHLSLFSPLTAADSLR